MADKPTVPLISTTGNYTEVPREEAGQYQQEGYTPASADQIQQKGLEDAYSTPLQQANTVAEGIGNAATFGGFSAVERALGENPEEMLARRQVNPNLYAAGQLGGLGLSAATGLGAMKAMGAAGEGVAGLVGLGAPSTYVGKVAASAVKQAAEMALFQGGDEVSKMFANDPNQTAQTALVDTGLSGLLGAGFGAFGTGVVKPAFQSAMAPLGDMLTAIRGKAISHELEKAAGLELPPEIRAGLQGESGNASATTLMDDASKAGERYRQTVEDVRDQAEKQAYGLIGREPGVDFSKYEHGKTVGETLAKEYQQKLDPTLDKYDFLKGKYSDVPLKEDTIVHEPNPDGLTTSSRVVPGTASEIAEDVSALAQKEGWTASPDSPIMRQVNNVVRDVGNLKTLKDISTYATRIGENMQSNPLEKALVRAGGMIKSVLRDAEDKVALGHLGAEAPELVNEYKLARANYAAQGELKDALESRLRLRASVGGYANALKEAASSDGESLIRKLSGKGDADLLTLLQQHFPQTAEAVRQYHLDALAANPGKYPLQSLIRSVDKLSPELKAFVLPPEKLTQLEAIKETVGKLPTRQNYSNTARILTQMWKRVPGGIAGILSGLTGHNPVLGYLLGQAAQHAGLEAPASIKLMTLKFLGSASEDVSPSAFKAGLDYTASAIKGLKTVSKAAEDVFTDKTIDINEPTEEDRAKLDKMVAAVQQDPNKLMGVGGNLGTYLPEHHQAVVMTASTAINYLASIKPEMVKNAPLDRPMSPDPSAEAKYRKALNIAQQPLTVLKSLQQGRLTAGEVMSLGTLYPDLYNQLKTSLMGQINGETKVPYTLRQGLSLFMAQPLDSTFSPASILAAQGTYAPQQPAAPLSGAAKGKQTSKTNLAKLPAQYQTPDQQRQAAKV